MSEEIPQMKIWCPHCERRLDVTLLEPFSVFPCPECGADVTVPKWWGDYLLESKIAVSDGIELYRALDTALDREVMIEMVTDAGGFSDEEKERYLTVIRRLASIVDPSLCVIYGCGSYEGGVYSVLQYLPEVMSEAEPHGWHTTRELLLPMLQGLDKVSSEEIYHGRISPRFIRKTESGAVCVTGFGAGIALVDHLHHDKYASPECMSGGEPTVTGDIFSLGKVIWQYLTGRLPEEGGQLRDDIPESVASLLRDMTALSPFDRPQSYRQILERLKDEGPQHNHTVMIKRAACKPSTAPKVKVTMRSTPQAVVAPPRRSGGGLVGVLLLLLVIALGMVAYLLYGRSLQEKEDVSVMPSQAVVAPPSSAQSSPSPAQTSSVSVQGSPAGQTAPSASPQLSLKAKDTVRISERKVQANLQGKIIPLPGDLRERRPRLASPLMAGSKHVTAFVQSLPVEYRRGVEAQVQLIGMSADLLRQYTAKIKFDRGPKTRLILYRTGRELHATVLMANEKGLLLRPLRRSGERIPRRIHIEDLHWKTYIEMLEYYGSYSLERFKELRTDTPDYKIAKKALVHHYLVLTLLCDWYRQHKETLKHARQCIKLEPKARDVLSHFGITP